MAHEEGKQSIVWLVKFWASLALFYWLHGTEWVEESLLEPFALLTAVGARAVLPRIGMDVQHAGTTIQAGGSTFEIAGSCTGTLVIFLFAAAVLSFPAPWKSRLKGLLVGLAGITLLNFVRTIFIVVVTSKFPQTFWMLHVVIGQAVVIVGTVGLYLWWIDRRGDVAFLPKGRREAAKTTALFLSGFVAGYAVYYFVFLESPMGEVTREMIGRHAAALLRFGFDASYRGEILQTAGGAVRLAPECLSSPMVVLFAAVTMALPVQFWKKLLVVAVGFWPVFYLYHLLSTVAVVASLAGTDSVNRSFVYLHMQQIIAIPALFALVAYYDWAERDAGKCLRHLGFAVALAVVVVPMSGAVGEVWRQFVLPALTERLSGNPELFFVYLKRQTSHTVGLTGILETMPDFEIFLWVTLTVLEPGFRPRTKAILAVAGVFLALAHSLAVVAVVELFELAPNAFLLQMWIVFAPFPAFYATKKLKRTIGKKEEKNGRMHLLQDREGRDSVR